MNDSVELILESCAAWCMTVAAAVAAIAFATFVVLCSVMLPAIKLLRLACMPVKR